MRRRLLTRQLFTPASALSLKEIPMTVIPHVATRALARYGLAALILAAAAGCGGGATEAETSASAAASRVWRAPLAG